jgi:hypothetical protein
VPTAQHLVERIDAGFERNPTGAPRRQLA